MGELTESDCECIFGHKQMYHPLRAATGYLELEMFEDARECLDEMSAEELHLPPVLLVRLEICRAMKRYGGMADVAEQLTKVFPDRVCFWINLAYAQRRHFGLEVAEKTLMKAQGLFPEDGTIHFNLACYACQLGRIEEARGWLGKAVSIDPAFQSIAMKDDDLEPLRMG